MVCSYETRPTKPHTMAMVMESKDQLWDSLCAKYQHDEKLHHAVWKMKKVYKRIEDDKKSKRIRLITLVDLPAPQVGANGIKNTQTVRCGAVTLNGKPCPFRATCGTCCKKHVV